mmetsp:Transcript_34035/g.105100  ORF Transcript_34035/g.105100 Transcript_34035/m.105100 type:complete len:83 (+) Transcript_34035:78-326(+)
MPLNWFTSFRKFISGGPDRYDDYRPEPKRPDIDTHHRSLNTVAGAGNGTYIAVERARERLAKQTFSRKAPEAKKIKTGNAWW